MAESGEDPGRSAEGAKDPTGGAGPGQEESVEFGAGKGPAEADKPKDPETEPGSGGYAGRDPKTQMPRVPSVPESQDDEEMEHEGAPPENAPEPPASN